MAYFVVDGDGNVRGMVDAVTAETLVGAASVCGEGCVPADVVDGLMLARVAREDAPEEQSVGGQS